MEDYGTQRFLRSEKGRASVYEGENLSQATPFSPGELELKCYHLKRKKMELKLSFLDVPK